MVLNSHGLKAVTAMSSMLYYYHYYFYYDRVRFKSPRVPTELKTKVTGNGMFWKLSVRNTDVVNKV